MSYKMLARTVVAVALLALPLLSCTELNKLLAETPTPTPTKTKMEGVWVVTAAFNEAGDSITQRINFPITAFYLSSDNTVLSTAGPMMMYIVYGDSKYTQIAGDVDQVFNYASLNFTGGEFFVDTGVIDNFTLEMKLQGVPGQTTITSLLSLIGINSQWLQAIIYHKFMNVGVGFDSTGNTMTWTFDAATTAVYNTKDATGNYVLWSGWPVTGFTRGKFVLTKQTSNMTLTDVVKAAETP